jgi:succinate dehydrogenase flavin-adding protein (antitoxin of CptAB toxin-antitoxin module)
MLNNIKIIKNKVQDINKELIYNYDYYYYDTNIAGYKKGEIIPNNNLNKKFGSSRRGYEMFKEEHDELSVGHSGETSIREIYTRKTKDLVGYIMETKKVTRPYLDEADSLHDEAILEFKNLLGVTDDKALEFYLNENNTNDFFNKDRVNNQLTRINRLIKILDEYYNNNEFKHFFDKIIKS